VHIDADVARRGLAFFGVDELGLDRPRARCSSAVPLVRRRPVGLSTLATSTSEPQETVEDVYEPFSHPAGPADPHARGRVAMPAAWKHLGLAPPLPKNGRCRSSSEPWPREASSTMSCRPSASPPALGGARRVALCSSITVIGSNIG
jgi:hypothetical protein